MDKNLFLWILRFFWAALKVHLKLIVDQNKLNLNKLECDTVRMHVCRMFSSPERLFGDVLTGETEGVREEE